MKKSIDSPRIAILGGGNVAEALGRALPQAERFSSRHPAAIEADLVILAVSDRAIREVSAAFDFGNALVVHTSGSCGWDELAPNIARRGVFYPLQTFTKGRPVDFREIPIFIEADNEADLALLQRVSASLSGRVVRSDAAMRRKAHVGAVFVCNFVNDLYAVGEEWMKGNGLDFSLLKPLIAETTQKMLTAASPRLVQTGPAAREDWPTIEAHRALLESRPDLKEIYDVLTQHIIDTQRHGKL